MDDWAIQTFEYRIACSKTFYDAIQSVHFEDFLIDKNRIVQFEKKVKEKAGFSTEKNSSKNLSVACYTKQMKVTKLGDIKFGMNYYELQDVKKQK